MLTTTRVCLYLLEANVAKVGVRNVFDKDPSELDDLLPFVGCPYVAASQAFNLKRGCHLRELRGSGVRNTHRR